MAPWHPLPSRSRAQQNLSLFSNSPPLALTLNETRSQMHLGLGAPPMVLTEGPRMRTRAASRVSWIADYITDAARELQVPPQLLQSFAQYYIAHADKRCALKLPHAEFSGWQQVGGPTSATLRYCPAMFVLSTYSTLLCCIHCCCLPYCCLHCCCFHCFCLHCFCLHCCCLHCCCFCLVFSSSRLS